MDKNKKTIGILGGMGPQASARLVAILIEMSSKIFGAKNGDDFPEVILDSIPVPDFISDSKNLKPALAMLKERVRLLSRMNVSIFAIACNTAHILFDDIQSVTDMPIVSIVDEVEKRVRMAGMTEVGLLASPSTIRFGVFEKALNKSNINVVLPTKRQQRNIEKIIRNVISGNRHNSDTLQLRFIANSLRKRGAEGIILGCTELPLIFPKKFSIPVFDTLEILAQALLRSKNFSSLRKFYGGNTIRA